MVRQDNADAVVKIAQLVRLHRLGALKFQIHQRKAAICSLAQHRELVGDGTLEFAAIYGATAGRDEGRFGMQLEEGFELRQRRQRLRKVV